MLDETIYFINQYSVLKRPKIWSRRGYWTFQAVSSIIGVPLLVLFLMWDGLPLTSTIIVIVAVFIGSSYNFLRGRQRAERYKIELASGIGSPYYGKYPIEQTRYFMGL
jgi:hypothetical protein